MNISDTSNRTIFSKLTWREANRETTVTQKPLVSDVNVTQASFGVVYEKTLNQTTEFLFEYQYSDDDDSKI